VLSARIHCIPGYPESILPLSKIPFFSIILEIAIMPTTQNATTRKTAPRTTTRRQKQDAITLLTDDHDKVKKMFKDYDKLCKKDDTEGKEALSGQICRALTVHSQLEEEIFYPVVRKAIDDDTLMNEAIIEHTTAKDLEAQVHQAASLPAILHKIPRGATQPPNKGIAASATTIIRSGSSRSS
jgi:hypothetical protein